MVRFLKLLMVFLLFSYFSMNELIAEEILTWEDCVKETMKNHPDLIAEKEKVNQARADKAISVSDLLPQISSSLTGKTSSNWPPDKDEWSAYVTVTLPIFEGGSRIAEVSKARATFKQAEADEMSGRDTVILTLEETWKEFQDAIDGVDVKQKFLGIRPIRDREKV